MAGQSASTPTPVAADRRWLFGPVSDLVLGCGLAYWAVFAAHAVAGDEIRALPGAHMIPFFVILTCGIPHYGATLLRVYERSEDRRAYVFFTVWVTIAVWLAFALGTRFIAFGSLWLTLYLTWSPWHYTGQNYGVALMFLRRRGIAFDERTKTWIWLSFVLGYGLTLVTIHGAAPHATYAPVSYQGTVYRFLGLGIPTSIAEPLFVVLALGWVTSLVISGVRLLRVAPAARDLAPAAVLAVTQSLWFVVPVAVRAWNVGPLLALDPLSNEQAAYSFFWIAAGHCVQYLWVTAYYAAPRTDVAHRSRWLAKSMLAGTGIWVLPPLLFAPGVLGRVPFDVGLALLGSATVNLHHFLLDGAIWKLRDGRVARILLRPAPTLATADETPRPTWPRRMVWATCGLALALLLGAAYETEAGWKQAAAHGDTTRVEQAAKRLAWMGRDGPDVWSALGRLQLQRNRTHDALRAFEHSLAVHPRAEAWLGIGSIHEGAQRLPEAKQAYDAALAIDPLSVPGLFRAASVRRALGERDEARALLRRAAEIAPNDRLVKLALEAIDADRS